MRVGEGFRRRAMKNQKIFGAKMQKIKTKSFKSAKSMWFYIGFMALPMLQFIIFYIGVNFNSFLLAFRNIVFNSETKRYDYFWTFNNFTNWFKDTNEFELICQTLKISLKTYAIMLIVGVPLGLFFAYYIFKKLPGSMFFRFMLFMPSIIASIVLVTIFRYFTDYVVPEMLKLFNVKLETTLLSSKSTRYVTVMFYNIFVSFGTSVLLYSNKMASISPEMTEAAELDGANAFQEFFHIVLPQVFSTLSVFLITGIAALFTNEINNFSFFNYNWKPDTATLGFLMYFRTQKAKADISQYPPLAALGLMMSAIAIPLTFLVRWLLNKYGPSED